jgi:hypothetical protein
VYQIYNGPESDQNQKHIVLTEFPRGFGNTSVIDWAAYDDILPKGKLVARAQGIHVQAGVSQPSRWFTSFNLVFTDGRYACMHAWFHVFYILFEWLCGTFFDFVSIYFDDIGSRGLA